MLAYSDFGKGDAVVLLHGFCENRQIWQATASVLSKNRRILCIDLPGFGESPSYGKFDMEYMAERLNELLKKLRINRFVLIGHSMGGYVALAYKEKYPETLKGLGFFHSTSFPDDAEKKKKRNATVKLVQEKGAKAFAALFTPSLFSEKNKKKFADQVHFWTRTAADTPAETIIGVTKAMRDRKDRRKILKNISVPVLFIAGKDDAAVPLERTLAECSLPSDASVHIFSHTGHMAFIEKQQESALALKHLVDYCLKK